MTTADVHRPRRRTTGHSGRRTLDVLIVEDDDDQAGLLELSLSVAGRFSHSVRRASTLEAALDALGQGRPDVVLLDLTLPDATDLIGLTAIATRAPTMPIVVVTSHSMAGLAQRVLAAGAQDVVSKAELGGNTIAVAVEKAVERCRAEAIRAALIDHLTQLPNRPAFENTVSTLVGNDQPTSVIYLDLDGFRLINDTHGHHVGDEVIRQLAQRLAGSIRPDETVARIAGSALTIAAATDIGDAAEALARRLVAVIERPFETREGTHHVGAFVGLAVAASGETGADVTARAEDAAIEARRLRATLRTSGEEARQRRARAVELQTGLAGAIAQRGLTVHYQPLMDLRTTTLIGYEALVRWQHPEMGFVPPDEFVTLAERTQLIHRLGRFVTSQALTDLGRLSQVAPVSVSINSSVAELVHDGFEHAFLGMVAASGIDPRQVCIELTETMAATDLSRVAEALQVLADAGVAVALDDFGTGFASLALLRELPLTKVKLDRSLVSNLSDPREREITRATVELLHNMDLTIVAEGIEEDDQRKILVDMDCDQGQGWLFGRPAPVDAHLGHAPAP